MNEWISVKDHLPKHGVKNPCLITDGKNVGIGWISERTKHHIENDDVPWNDETAYLQHDITGWPKVTHWKELPKPPRVS